LRTFVPGTTAGPELRVAKETDMSARDLWSAGMAVVAVGTLVLAIVESDPLTVVLTMGGVFVLAVLVLGVVAKDDPGDPAIDWARVRWRAGCGACLVVGLPALWAISPAAVWTLLLVLVGCSPSMVARWQRYIPAPAIAVPEPSSRPYPPGSASGSQAQTAEGVTRLLETGATPELLASTDTATICAAWRRSYLMLGASATVGEMLVVTQLRQHYLDELARRDPRSFASWLSSVPRPSSAIEGFPPAA
jgi:hypothetical protein